MNIESINILTDDDQRLKGQFFETSKPKAVVQINCATATSCTYYRNFATFLCNQGFSTLIWDYRGVGSSKVKSCREDTSSIFDYGVHDMPAVTEYLLKVYPDTPIILIGHSLGGQLLPWNRHYNKYAGVIAIATSSGYLPNLRMPYMLKAFFYFYLFCPLSLTFFGFAKNKLISKAEDLPANVLREWRNFSRKKDYFFDNKFTSSWFARNNYANLEVPICVIYSSDDEIATPKNIRNFWKHLTSANGIEFMEIQPAETKRKIGHFGYFRESEMENLWYLIASQIDTYAHE